MPLSRTATVAGLILMLMLASCAREAQFNRYQIDDQQQPGQGAVAELQRNAIGALNRQAYQQAIEYLERAIKIEPRNPFSWHYLAQTYWHRKEFDRCLAMVERSFSYSSSEDNLDHANSQLKQQCQG